MILPFCKDTVIAVKAYIAGFYVLIDKYLTIKREQ